MHSVLNSFISIMLTILFLSTCSVDKTGEFGYFSVDQEWEIQLEIYEDYTFKIEDKYGCNQLKQTGEWQLIEEANNKAVILLMDKNIEINKGTNLNGKEVISYFDSLTNTYYQNPIENQFPLIDMDTIYLEKGQLKLKNYTFKRGLDDLQNKRILEIEKSYINDIGKDQYIKLLGDGISIKRARENLKKCGVN